MVEAPANIQRGLPKEPGQYTEFRPETVTVQHEGQPMDLTGCQRVIVYQGQALTEGPNTVAKTYVELQFEERTSTYRLDAAHNPTVRIIPHD